MRGNDATGAPLPDGRGSAGEWPLAYLITFTCSGTWLHGRGPGSVDKRHNQPGTPFVPPDEAWIRKARSRMDQPPYRLDADRQRVVLDVLQEVCRHRGWTLLAAHVRTNHVHAVVRAEATPEKVMGDWKAYASRRLNESGFDEPARKRWTRHGSTEYLWEDRHVEGAVQYVLHGQGQPMAVFPGPPGPASEPRP